MLLTENNLLGPLKCTLCTVQCTMYNVHGLFLFFGLHSRIVRRYDPNRVLVVDIWFCIHDLGSKRKKPAIFLLWFSECNNRKF